MAPVSPVLPGWPITFSVDCVNESDEDAGPVTVLFGLDGTPYFEGRLDGLAGGGRSTVSWEYQPAAFGDAQLGVGDHWATIVIDPYSQVCDDSQLSLSYRTGQVNFRIDGTYDVDGSPVKVPVDHDDYWTSRGWKRADVQFAVSGPYGAPVGGCLFYATFDGNDAVEEPPGGAQYSDVTSEAGVLELNDCLVWPDGLVSLTGYNQQNEPILCTAAKKYHLEGSSMMFEATMVCRDKVIHDTEVEETATRLSAELGGEVEVWKLRVSAKVAGEYTRRDGRTRGVQYTIQEPQGTLEITQSPDGGG
jgi:hypothetical protein